jgi:hypothetical protein
MSQGNQLRLFLEANNLMGVTMHMQTYLQNGKIDFTGLMAVPSSNRIPALSKSNPMECMVAVNSATLMFLQSSGVDANTSVMITSSILMESHEDNLAIEDVVIFLMKLNAGQYGKFFGAITPASFMEKFEEYRQERHEAILSIREEEQANHRAAGITERESDNTTDPKDLHRMAVFQHYAQNK